MAGKSEQVTAHDIKNADWDTPFRNASPCEVGEFSRLGTNPVVADLYANTFSETSRTPLDGDMSRDQAKFPTRDAKGRQA